MPQTTLEQYEALAAKYAGRNNDWWPAAAALRHYRRALRAACASGRLAAQRAADELGIDLGQSLKTADIAAEDFLAATAEPEEASDDRES